MSDPISGTGLAGGALMGANIYGLLAVLVMIWFLARLQGPYSTSSQLGI